MLRIRPRWGCTVPRNGREGQGCPLAEALGAGDQVGSQETSCKSRSWPLRLSQASRPLSPYIYKNVLFHKIIRRIMILTIYWGFIICQALLHLILTIALEEGTMLRVPKTTLKFNDLLRGLAELRKSVILMIMVYYSKRMQIKISKRKGAGEIRWKPPVVFSQWNTKDRHNSPSNDVWQYMQSMPTRKAHLSLGVQGLIGGQSHRYGLPT